MWHCCESEPQTGRGKEKPERYVSAAVNERQIEAEFAWNEAETEEE